METAKFLRTSILKNICFRNPPAESHPRIYKMHQFNRLHCLKSQKQPPKCSKKIAYSQENTCVTLALVAKACSFIKKETLAQVFFHEFAKFLQKPFLQNTYGQLLKLIMWTFLVCKQFCKMHWLISMSPKWEPLSCTWLKIVV